MNPPTWVIKMGGSVEREGVAPLATFLHDADGRLRVVVVHGGGPEITRALAAAGIEAVFRDGLRVTSKAAAGVVRRVLAEEINAELVNLLREAGLPAEGIAGDEGVLTGRSFGAEWAQTGYVDRVEPAVIETVWERGGLPVLAPTARDDAGEWLNVNADDAAAAVARRVRADALVFLTDVPYVRVPATVDHPGLVRRGTEAVAELTADAARWLLELPDVVTAGMRPKIRAAVAAVAEGVACAWIVDGRDPALLRAVLERPGERPGTLLVPSRPSGSSR
jgi:acetylglutamate kinase